MPQCGLAPGFIGIVAHHLAQGFDTLHEVKMRVGALPAFPTNALKYNLTWSVDGLINEYCHPCEAIRGGKNIEVLPLEGLEHFSLDGTEYEAFNTSGGLGTLCETLAGRVQTLDYKSVRYPGHRDLMKMLLEELQLNQDTETLKAIMRKSIPSTMQDVVLVFVTVSGMRDGAAGAGGVRAQDLRRPQRGRAAVGDPDHHRRRRLRRGRPVPRGPAAAARLHPPGAGGAARLPGQPLRQRLPAVAAGGKHRLTLRVAASV
jgi:saccharopine dehydrogenase-like NADP-dependent oxidoreductase